MTDPGLAAEIEHGSASEILPMQVNDPDDGVFGENQVCLHAPAARNKPTSDHIINHHTDDYPSGNNTHIVSITSRTRAANIAAMPIRSHHPDRRYLEVGQRIEAVRLYAGLTTTEMATIMGDWQGRYTALHYGRALPDAEKLEPLCERFGVTLDWLYRGDNRLMPVGIWDGVKTQLATLIDEHGRPHHRPPGRPMGTGRKKAKTDAA